jgi:uncharacterized membrane protein
MHIILINLISLLGLSGLVLSSYIYFKKKKKKKMICPMRSNCDTVIHSDHSKILGIPVELLGMTYYAFIGLSYVFVSLLGLWSMPVAMILIGVSGSALLFSIYLVSLQAFVIKHWCTWCLFSAGICLTIFILSYINITLY